MTPVRETVRAAERESRDSLPGNVRASLHRGRLRDQRTAGVVLVNLSSRVEEPTGLLIEVPSRTDRAAALQGVVRLPTAQVLAILARATRAYSGWQGDPTGDPTDTEQVLRGELQRLSAAVTSAPHDTERNRQTAGAVVTSVRRCLGTLQVHAGNADPEAVLPTPWRQPGGEPLEPVRRRRSWWRGRRPAGNGPHPHPR